MVNVNLDEFSSAYPAHEPLRPHANEDELRLLGPGDGVREMQSPPAEGDQCGVPACKGDDACHLWVFGTSSIPYVLETAPNVSPPLKSGMAKHTNLTGGAPASCGGELWIDPVDRDKLYVNGCSGRYGPRTAAELEDAVSVFEDRGFGVVSFGWDDDAGKPAMVLRQ